MSGIVIEKNKKVGVISPGEVVTDVICGGRAVTVNGEVDGFMSTTKGSFNNETHIVHRPGGLFSSLLLKGDKVVVAAKD